MTNKIILTYAVYLPVAIGLTLYVARTLFRNGRVFLLDIFKGKADITDATTVLFETGFYLLNIGFALLIMRVTEFSYSDPFDTNQEVVETLARKLGGFAIYLGIMLFFNLFLFFRGRRKARQNGNPTGPSITIPAQVSA